MIAIQLLFAVGYIIVNEKNAKATTKWNLPETVNENYCHLA